MTEQFWLERWQRGETGWHLNRVHPKLQRWWPIACADAAAKAVAGEKASVFVPLCGKSLDMLWLRAQGLDVIGVELSEPALSSFTAEQSLALERADVAGLPCFSANGWSLYPANFFALSSAHVASTCLIYDRAALIALTPAQRSAYVAHLRQLFPQGASLLLITLSYDQALMNGPPYAVSTEEVEGLFGFAGQIDILEQHNIIGHEPRFAAKGLPDLFENVYYITW